MNLSPVVIKIEMESLRHQVSLALSQHAINIDDMIESAIDEFATPEHLAGMVTKVTREVTALAVEESVRRFFTYGAGRKAIDDAVHSKLEQSLAVAEKLAHENP